MSQINLRTVAFCVLFLLIGVGLGCVLQPQASTCCHEHKQGSCRPASMPCCRSCHSSNWCKDKAKCDCAPPCKCDPCDCCKEKAKR